MKPIHPIDRFSRPLAAAAALSLLGGCSMFTNSVARSASEIATQNAVKAIREVDLDRQVDVTLIGGRELNLGRGSVARPVQACVYVVQSPDWRPPSLGGAGCASRERDSSLIAAERRMVAPNQVQQFQVKAPGVREAWLVVDADFASRPVDYVPLNLRIEGHGTIRVSAWLEGNAIFDARQPLPVRVAAEPAAPVPLAAPVATRPVQPRMARAVETGAQRRIDLTLVGGRRLNADSEREAKPVRACVYVVTDADWQPRASQVAALRIDPRSDDAVVVSDCRIISPNQIEQMPVSLVAGREQWLVVDADFESRDADYVPLRVRLETESVTQFSAWLDGRGIFDGRQPLPAAATARSQDRQALPAPPGRPPQPSAVTGSSGEKDFVPSGGGQ